jgi:hypothetical protein
MREILCISSFAGLILIISWLPVFTLQEFSGALFAVLILPRNSERGGRRPVRAASNVTYELS